MSINYLLVIFSFTMQKYFFSSLHLVRKVWFSGSLPIYFQGLLAYIFLAVFYSEFLLLLDSYSLQGLIFLLPYTHLFLSSLCH